MHNPELPVVAAIAAVLILVPLPTQLRLCNVAILALIIGTFFVNVSYAVNTLVWAGNVKDVGRVWCQLTVSFSCYYQLSAEAAAMCICKHLEWVTSHRSAGSRKHNRRFFEVMLCCVFPLISIPTRYAVEPTRYMIFEDLGCLPIIHNSVLSKVIIYGPQLVLSLIALGYACKTVYNLFHRRAILCKANHCQIRTSDSILTKSRFTRLVLLCPVLGVWPGFAVSLVLGHDASNIVPWPGWSAVHASFNEIWIVPASDQTPVTRRTEMIIFWCYAITAYICFIVLSCGDSVREDLCAAWVFMGHKFTCRRTSSFVDSPVALSSKFPDSYANTASSSDPAVAVFGPGLTGAEKLVIIGPHQFPSVEP